MPRTTVDIDAPVLKDLKRLQAKTGLPLGRLISDLVVEGLAARRSAPEPKPVFKWPTRPMHARIDLEDKEAVWRELDRRDPEGR